MARNQGNYVRAPMELSGDNEIVRELAVAERSNMKEMLRWRGKMALALLMLGAVSVGAALGALLWSHSTTSAAVEYGARPLTIIISLDGFNHLYSNETEWTNRQIRPPQLTHLHKLFDKRGTLIELLQPSFPALTFPNHYTLVTGLYPSVHGIVDNTFYDPDRDTWFRPSDISAVSDQANWLGEPIWTTAERQGKRTMVYYWPGSQAPPHPTLYYPVYSANVSLQDRVEQLLKFLEPNQVQLFDVMMMYFEQPDKAGHKFGPFSEQVRDALEAVDNGLDELLDKVANPGKRPINLVIVSDHGMARVNESNVIYVEDYLDLDDQVIISALSPVLQLWARDASTGKPSRNATIVRNIMVNLTRSAIPCFEGIWERNDVPHRFEFGNASSRIAPVIALAREGCMIYSRRSEAWKVQGMHGYDNTLSSMGALMSVVGPAFENAAGITVPLLENIHVYNLLCHVIGVKPAPNNGSTKAIRILTNRERK